MSAVNPDPVERLLLDEALALVPSPRQPAALDIAPDAAMALAKRSSSGRCRVWVDSFRAEQTLARADRERVEVVADYGVELLHDADLVVMQLPRSLDALEQRSATVARLAAPNAILLAGGRIKHLSRGVNDVLGRHFGTVRASLGRQKSRVLIAQDPRPASDDHAPSRRRHDDLDLTVVAYGGAFAGTSVDLGTRALLEALAVPPGTTMMADLGCGTGVLASWLAARHPASRIVAVDDSAVACWSAAATAAASGVGDRVEVRRGDLLTEVPDASLDLVVCNPPFHRGAAKDSSDAFRMITESARVLTAGGELWMVFNAHLPYLPCLGRVVGPTEIARRTSSYLVTRSRRRTGSG